MVEVTFLDSVAGKIKICRNEGLLEGDPKDTVVLSLEFMLDIGYLDPGIESQYRADLPDEVYGTIILGPPREGDPYTEDEGDDESTGEKSLANWNALKGYLEEGRQVRVWWAMNPAEYCGLLHASSLLSQYPGQVCIIKCPDCLKQNGSTNYVHGWRQVEQEEMPKLLHLTYKPTQSELALYSHHWEKLVRENASLRTVIGGQVVSVPEDFYDVFIRKHFPFTGVIEGKLLQRVVVDTGFGVISSFYECRIQKMIESGEITVDEDSNLSYKRIISTR